MSVRRGEIHWTGRWLIYLLTLGALGAGVIWYQKWQEHGDRMRYGGIHTQNQIKQIALAVHGYHEIHRRIPSASINDKKGKPLLSWRVSLLPFLEQDSLFKEFKLDEPWDSPHNIRFLDKMPEVYNGQFHNPTLHLTPYQVFVGPGTIFERDGLTFKDIHDDNATTILLVAAKNRVPWTAPEDLLFGPERPLIADDYIVPGRERIIGAFADASVFGLPRHISSDTLRAAITRNGREKIDPARFE